MRSSEREREQSSEWSLLLGMNWGRAGPGSSAGVLGVELAERLAPRKGFLLQCLLQAVGSVGVCSASRWFDPC